MHPNNSFDCLGFVASKQTSLTSIKNPNACFQMITSAYLGSVCILDVFFFFLIAHYDYSLESYGSSITAILMPLFICLLL